MPDALGPKQHAVFDLYEFGVAIMEQNLRRRLPEASDEEIARALREWQLTRPGAPRGDAEGVATDRFATT